MKWKDYLYAEKMYIVLSLIAKSALAWQVFAGTNQAFPLVLNAYVDPNLIRQKEFD